MQAQASSAQLQTGQTAVQVTQLQSNNLNGILAKLDGAEGGDWQSRQMDQTCLYSCLNPST
ncbi:uncharacterized protein MEPE_05028 [Melanopsichium pennsylvanicum]|uniref:Uncharacterized protein n=1 Tax=Melanopsichium pennsylvanicum TaxID=63383 RepID=A0AAJ4XNR1_9BASI|nr:uncharacterized protein MEPE_05028 [Melanopsichium pennsylvanicum]